MDAPLIVRTDHFEDSRSSTVVIGVGAAEELGPRVAALEPDGVFVVGDARIPAVVADVARRVDARATLAIEAGEANKDLSTVVRLSGELARLGATRRSVVIGVGGGTLTDVVGFLCAIHLRGVRCVLCPTTTLALCDAALGGKNGVDVEGVKNVLGTTRQPELVVGDVAWLATLPDRACREGWAEVVKKAAVLDATRFEELEALAPGLVARRADAVATAIGMAVALKLALVVQDPFERGPRRALNFGHTIGHALESVAGLTLPHGEAVALGMLAECRAAGSALEGRLAGLLDRLGLPTRLPAELADPSRLWPIVLRDKKVMNGRVPMVVPLELGRGQVVELTYARLAAALS